MTVHGLLLAAGRGRRFDPAGHHSKLEALIDGEPVAVHALRSLAAGCDRVVAVCRVEQAALAQALEVAGATVVFLEPSMLSRTGEGMGVSLAAGARALAALRPAPVPGCDRDHEHDHQILVLPADMPWVRAQTVRQIVAVEAGATIVVPVLVMETTPGQSVPADPEASTAPDCPMAATATATPTASLSTVHALSAAGPRTTAVAVSAHRPDEGHPVRFAASLLGELAALDGDKGARVLFSRHAVTRLAVTDPGIIADVDTPADLGRRVADPRAAGRSP